MKQTKSKKNDDYTLNSDSVSLKLYSAVTDRSAFSISSMEPEGHKVKFDKLYKRKGKNLHFNHFFQTGWTLFILWFNLFIIQDLIKTFNLICVIFFTWKRHSQPSSLQHVDHREEPEQDGTLRCTISWKFSLTFPISFFFSLKICFEWKCLAFSFIRFRFLLLVLLPQGSCARTWRHSSLDLKKWNKIN